MITCARMPFLTSSSSNASRDGSVLNPSSVDMRWFFCFDRSSSSKTSFAELDLIHHASINTRHESQQKKKAR